MICPLHREDKLVMAVANLFTRRRSDTETAALGKVDAEVTKGLEVPFLVPVHPIEEVLRLEVILAGIGALLFRSRHLLFHRCLP
jgi:hypothetical protein